MRGPGRAGSVGARGGGGGGPPPARLRSNQTESRRTLKPYLGQSVQRDAHQRERRSLQRAPSRANPNLGRGYLQMERKEARIRLDQADALAQLTRRLNRARSGGGERITDNTLIRVAVDVLLARSDRLAGTTETELRDSLTL